MTPYRAAWIIPAMTVKDQMPPSDLSPANLRDVMIKYYETNIKVTEASNEKLLSTLWDKVPGNLNRNG